MEERAASLESAWVLRKRDCLRQVLRKRVCLKEPLKVFFLFIFPSFPFYFFFSRFSLPVTQLHFIPVDLGSPIVQCSVADPFVVIMTAEGVVTMFALKTDSYMGKTHRLALQKPQIHTV